MQRQRQAPPPAPRHTHSTCSKTSRYRHRKAAGGRHPVFCSQAKQHSNGAANYLTQKAPPISDAGRVALGHQGAGTPKQRLGPPPVDADTGPDLEMIRGAPAGSMPAEPASPAGSVQALCPAWKQCHCSGEGWCPGQHPRPATDHGALSTMEQAVARAPLRYGVVQGWIQDETTRGSVNIQDAVNKVAHTGQTEVALHTWGRQGRPAEGIVVEPTGTVLVLAADMVPGVLHVS